ncbi:dTDP-4-dehydrorhamnose 3,5-epimerase [Pseudonocardia sp. Ae406_Ps2]|uniref:dTDP-4-dehydrorhamnose 3,5-epimerase family protein n=1 Tax=unclassified Pseudonocardia TaxID=2619320 RepID=UPI00094B3546|nr:MULTISPECIES: dTDP-4-dehydrorhamnose 3,5-epimerase family protein [unclassified Pseudonocardia]OLL98417.1 dTDP-4-dehydrorhamnose 3,5-epimerase [Pseudonocardia sp. Ae331_Ps2]OLM03857.1 dTDP-4-dehydrorhamnose 3,5-epimerase [Pseudonocardia sp. Ae406_Ps2]OLM11294.1 dTDP-4-dehydrorhamnose 3,5-epimerase [Pseudonocardia sp. Ae505_Ps2]OLM25414.1 dTDP-4-dehydrorhamnose 3,5-epimerase [Pseudonocardia sp. Ae706_Ps2]OLM34402.1 dTDP-4-dehydrorhamnose 3,5-epimerase [Pseudonocardia sp. Ae717_Ps2]
MDVVRTVVPGALLLDPTATGASGPDLAPFTVRRRRRPAQDAVLGLFGHPGDAMLLGVPRGSGYAVVIDARPDGGTFGRLAVALLEGPQRLLVPPGCLYGVQSVASGTVVELRSVTRLPRRERFDVDPDDPDLAVRWLRPRPSRTPGTARSWAALIARLGAPAGPRRDRVSLW